MPLDIWNNVAGNVNFNLEIDAQRFLDEVPTSSKVLDFGCGYGRVANEIHACGYVDIVGTDPSPAMMARGRELHPHLHLVHAPGTVLPFADEMFDAVVACAVFTCIPSGKARSEATGEITRILKPGGVVHISEFCSLDGREFTPSFGVRMRHSRVEELKALVGQLDVFHEEIIDASTMNGSHVECYRVFARKPLNKRL